LENVTSKSKPKLLNLYKTNHCCLIKIDKKEVNLMDS